jgi:hypothetical protein
MKRKAIRFIALVCVTTTILLLSPIMALPAWAAPGLSVDGVKLDIDLYPGQAYTHTMTITSGADYPMEMLVEARGFGQSLDGMISALPTQEDISPYTAQPFISSIDTLSFHLEPGSSQQVKATVNVPADTTPGTKYAILYVHSKPGGKTGIGVILATNVLVIIHVPGSQEIKEGEITSLESPQPEPGKLIKVLTTYKNTGNIHYMVKNKVTITDEAGKTVAQTVTPLTSTSIVPTFSRLCTTTLALPEPGKNLPAGTYTVESGILLDDGTLLDTKKANFEITGEPVSAAALKEASATEDISPIGALPKASSSALILGHQSKGTNWSMIGIIITSVICAGATIAAVIITRRRNRATENNNTTEQP